ncbi:MAG: collagen-like protein [Comamonadaceae bacterium]|mgnify:CR=1 FL=1|jgi:hypothetical protein|nr:collagen-like protein [Hydrogenophaga borbori]NCT99815.1 collagen-like protein [Comamonadaceae bacterium]
MRWIQGFSVRALAILLVSSAMLAACGGGDHTQVVERVEQAPVQAVVLSGMGPPDAALGQDGQFYLDAQALKLYGPRANGQWPLLTAIGGAPGADGQDGRDGSRIYRGTGAPSNALGQDGDFYLDDATATLLGPKVAGAWPPTGLSLAGPAGPAGANGQDGQNGQNGAAGPQGPAGPATVDIQWGIASNSTFGNGAYYLWPQGPNAAARNPVLLPRACTQARLRVATFGVPSPGDTFTFTVWHTPGPALLEASSTATALVCQIDSGTRACDVGAAMNLAAGDAIEVRLVGTEAVTAMATPGSWGIGFTCQ